MTSQKPQHPGIHEDLIPDDPTYTPPGRQPYDPDFPDVVAVPNEPVSKAPVAELDDEPTTCYVTFIVHDATLDDASSLVGEQWDIDEITTQAEEDERAALVQALKDAAAHMVLTPTMGNLARLADAARAMGVDL